MPRRLAHIALRLVGPLLLVLVIARLDDPGAMLATLARADAAPLALAVLLLAVGVHLKVLRWDVMLRARGIHYARRRAYAAFMSSLYVGMITPGRVGDVLRAQYLRHDNGVAYAEGLASVVMDRVCDLYVLVVFASLGIVRFSSVIVGELRVVAWAAVALTVLGPLVLFLPGVAEALMSRAYARFVRGGDPGGLSRFLEALRALAGRQLATTVPLTILAFLVNYLQGWLMAGALHITLGYLDVVCLVSIASLLALLPISVSGVGVREAFFAVAFPVLGHDAAAGVSFGLLFFVVNHLALIVAGFVSFQLVPPPVARTTSGATQS